MTPRLPRDLGAILDDLAQVWKLDRGQVLQRLIG